MSYFRYAYLFRYAFLILLNLNFFHSFSQFRNDAQKTLNFDIADSATFNLPEVKNIIYVAYKRLKKDRTLKSQVELEKRRDSILSKNFPFKYSFSKDTNVNRLSRNEIKMKLSELRKMECKLDSMAISLNKGIDFNSPSRLFYGSLLVFAWEYSYLKFKDSSDKYHYNVGGVTMLNWINKDDFKIDTVKNTVTVFFRKNMAFDEIVHEKEVFYINPLRRIFKKRKVEYKSLYKKNNILLPSSEYAIVFISTKGSTLLPLLKENYEVEKEYPYPKLSQHQKLYDNSPKQGLILPVHPQEIQKAWSDSVKSIKSVLNSISKNQSGVGLNFFSNHWRHFDNLYFKTKPDFIKIDSLKNIFDSINLVFTSDIIRKRNNSISLFNILANQLRIEQAKNYSTTGMTRDSLTHLINIIGCLQSIDAAKFNSINKGYSSLLNCNQYSTVNTIVQQLSILNENHANLNALGKYINGIIVSNVQYRNLDILFDTLLVPFMDNILMQRKVLLKIKETNDSIMTKADDSEMHSGVSEVNTATFVTEFLTRGKLSIVPDFGLIYYGFIPWNSNKNFQSISPYIGVHINFRPFNKNAKFRLIPDLKLFSLHRWSAMLGVSLISLKLEGKRENLFANGGLMTGIGYRLGSSVRIIGGSLWFKKYDPDFFSNNKKIAATPFAGISIDFDLKDIFNNVFNNFVK